MPIDSSGRQRAFTLTGSFRIECDDLQFDLKFTPRQSIAEFSSFGMLFRARRRGGELGHLIADIPLPLQSSLSVGASQIQLLAENFILATVKGRPIGKVRFKNGKFSFRPTPLRFFSKID